MDMKKAAESKTYADEIKGIVQLAGLEITELTSHLQGQLVAVHPTFDSMFDVFAPKKFQNDAKARTEWAVKQLEFAAKASNNLGPTAHATFSGALLWHTMYPWPQRQKSDVKDGFNELAKRWLPILNKFDEAGCDLCYEIHPGEDLHDGITFERFLKATNGHKRAKILYDPSHFVLQQLNYLDFIDIYHEYIKMFHVKDAEFNPNGRSGVYVGYQDWVDRPGRFRSPGDGQVNFKSIFSKLTQYDYPGWAVLEWECCLKNQIDGAKEGAEFIGKHIIRVGEKPFDDFAGKK
jgi:sugar phosphate isomerase/epimerase